MRKMREIGEDQIPPGTARIGAYMGPVTKEINTHLAPPGANACVATRDETIIEVHFYRLEDPQKLF